MRADCIQAVGRALGRTPNQGETRDIENRIRLSRRKLAEADPQRWQTLPADEQIRLAGEDAAADLLHEAALKRHRVAMGILAHDKMRNYIDAQVAAGIDKDGIASLSRMLTSEADGKNNIVSVEGAAQGIEASASSFMSRSWNVAGGKFLKLLRDKVAEATLVRALHGDTSVPEAFRKAAADFHEVAERLRQRFNAAGGDIGRLENWGMPHSWSRMRLLKLGRQAWTDAMLPRLDRSQYVHEDGRSYTDAELRDFLGEAWRSVVTEGANKVLGKGGHVGGGIKANRNSAERQIHLKDAQAYLEAMGQFSERGVLDAMMGHVHRMARDIALVEQFGPNADRQFAHFLEQETAKVVDADPAKKGTADKRGRFVERLYNFIAGNGAPPPETMLGKAATVYRRLQVLKLGSALISSFGDHATMHLTAHVNGIPKFKLFLNNLRTTYGHPFLKQDRERAEAAGLMVRTYAQQLARYGSEVGGHGWSSKLTNTFMKVTLLPYFTEARRRAFSYGMMDQIGKALRDHSTMAALNDADQRFLKHSGITESDWQLMRLAQPDDWGGNHSLITPEEIYRIPDAEVAKVTDEHPDLARDRAASSLMAFVYGEQDRAVIEPHAKSRLHAGADINDDGIKGFLVHSFTTFRSFSFEMYEAHIKRALHGFETKRGSAAYMAALIAASTVLGAVANGIRDIVFGRDPRSLNVATTEGRKNWLAAMITGGGLSVYGDFLINTYSSRGSSLSETAAGPMVQDIGALLNVVQQTVAQGTDPDADLARKLRPTGASTVRTLKSYVPGASLWYTRAAMDRLIFNQLSDYFSPGYLQRMKARARQQHRPNWWEVDEPLPSRAPNPDTIAQ